MSNSENLAALFAAIFGFVRDRLHGQVDVDEIKRIARTVLDQMHVAARPVTWADAEPLTVRGARWTRNIGRAVRVVGYVSELHDPACAAIPVDDGEEQVETTAARITGIDGEQLYMLDVIGRPLIEKVQEAHRTSTMVEFLGLMVVLPVELNPKRPPTSGLKGHFFLHLADVRASASAFDILGATRAERDAARENLARLRAEGVLPIDHLRRSVLTNLGVTAVDIAGYLNDAFECVTLQAVSDGEVGNSPARIHGLFVGPPGRGKKLIGQGARALNPVAQEASASKVSPAGLVGASHRTTMGWTSTPGLLPLASHGVLVVQDAHGWSTSRLTQINPILQEVMEDGEVRDSVAGGRKRSAPTSLLIDLNRTAHLGVGAGGARREAPLLSLLPLLSRFDVIMEISVDPHQAWEVGARMYSGMRQGTAPLEQQPWVRDARLLVAALRDEHRMIDLTPVVATMTAAHLRFRADFEPLFETNPLEASAVPVRLSVSMARLVLASARACDRSVATPEDVDRAVRFLSLKLAYIRRAATNVPMSNCPNVRQERRDAYYTEAVAGRPMRPEDVAEEYKSATGEVITQKTVRRDFERLKARRVGGGLWLLPPGAGRDNRTNGHRGGDDDESENEDS